MLGVLYLTWFVFVCLFSETCSHSGALAGLYVAHTGLKPIKICLRLPACRLCARIKGVRYYSRSSHVVLDSRYMSHKYMEMRFICKMCETLPETFICSFLLLFSVCRKFDAAAFRFVNSLNS